MTPLEIALHEESEGVREATGQNDGVPSERYMGGKREPWCAHFICWCWAQAGRPLPEYIPSKAPPNEKWNPLASVAALLSLCRKHSWAFQDTDATPPKPGDLVFLGERGASDPSGSPAAGHVGIVALVGEGYVISIDGNWSNAVSRVSRPRRGGPIVGYARPWGG